MTMTPMDVVGAMGCVSRPEARTFALEVFDLLVEDGHLTREDLIRMLEDGFGVLVGQG